MENEKFNEGVEEYNQRVKEENEKTVAATERSWKEWKIKYDEEINRIRERLAKLEFGEKLTGHAVETDKVSFAAYKEATDAIIRDIWTALG